MPEGREKVTLRVEEYEREWDEPNSCYEWGYRYYIDDAHVSTDSEFYTMTIENVLRHLGYEVTTEIVYLHGDINFEGANSNE